MIQIKVNGCKAKASPKEFAAVYMAEVLHSIFEDGDEWPHYVDEDVLKAMSNREIGLIDEQFRSASQRIFKILRSALDSAKKKLDDSIGTDGVDVV